MPDKELSVYRADLHIHTCLSPCGDWDMTPRTVVERCAEKKITMIAITDHNSVENVRAAMVCAATLGVTIFPGMEICSQEDVHILALFDDIEQAMSMQDLVYDHLHGENNPDVFGYQVMANEHDEVEGQNSRMLIGAVKLSLRTLVDAIHERKGLAIAAHIDKQAYSIMALLGFIPPDLPLDAVEVSYRMRPQEANECLMVGALPCVTSSDAHFIHEIGRVTTKFYLAEPSLAEIKKALQGTDGRYIMHSKKVIS